MMALALPHFAAVLVCKVRGHKWRRPHVGEWPDGSAVRYCRRCGACREVKARKAKQAVS